MLIGKMGQIHVGNIEHAVLNYLKCDDNTLDSELPEKEIETRKKVKKSEENSSENSDHNRSSDLPKSDENIVEVSDLSKTKDSSAASKIKEDKDDTDNNANIPMDGVKKDVEKKTDDGDKEDRPNVVDPKTPKKDDEAHKNVKNSEVNSEQDHYSDLPKSDENVTEVSELAKAKDSSEASKNKEDKEDKKKVEKRKTDDGGNENLNTTSLLTEDKNGPNVVDPKANGKNSFIRLKILLYFKKLKHLSKREKHSAYSLLRLSPTVQMT